MGESTLKPEYPLGKPPVWGHHGTVATRKAGNIPGWEPYSFDYGHPDSVQCIIEGSIPRLLKSGPNKGRKTHRDNTEYKRVLVTNAEVYEERVRFERETGYCSECFGSGLQQHGWDRETGRRYKGCSRCGATGKARGMEELRREKEK